MTGSGKSLDKRVLNVFLNADSSAKASEETSTISDVVKNQKIERDVLKDLGIPQNEIDIVAKYHVKNEIAECAERIWYNKKDTYTTAKSDAVMMDYYVTAAETFSEQKCPVLKGKIKQVMAKYNNTPT